MDKLIYCKSGLDICRRIRCFKLRESEVEEGLVLIIKKQDVRNKGQSTCAHGLEFACECRGIADVCWRPEVYCWR